MAHGFKKYIYRWAKALLRVGVPRLKPKIVRELAHDPRAFTQGLAFSDGRIYESTGKPGESSVRCLDPGNGQLLQLQLISDTDVWAEGLSVRGNRLFQLTWKHHKAFVYSLPDLVPAGEVRYDGEGWGLATGDGFFVMSDGSEQLMVCDQHFKVIRKTRVVLNWLPIRHLNDLEFVNGVIFANVWFCNDIFAISAQSGKVLAVYDCRELFLLENPSQAEAVLNGIAYNSDRGTFFLTGKYWKRIYEVEFESFV